MKDSLKLILVTQRDSTPIDNYLRFIERCARAGVTAVQLREKGASYDLLLEFARRLKETLAPFEIPLIINDSIDLAQAVEAEGVHLGQTDGSPEAAREILGENALIGQSIESLEELDKANASQALNYVAASAVFETKTKKNLKKIWGLSGLKDLAARSNHPVIGIGGINLSNVDQVIDSGAQGVAVVSTLHSVEDLEQGCSQLLSAVNRGACHA
ncbi:thiamine phosphate synthase [Candidatus Neptunochlamydia vexilliferae]|uniref:Thiamine-phosphate synthase n=1 Tax=Candidatus Neptunichlamydia vexilliferae TaxID=1651774 RepID=A0ABS0AZG1_9BACT|nr:thiamine phosphate synthase [Candidatus Neptunochlamydia vexilliferae]MBF5059522.1 Thiamine-phosphate synthase [Candidatus Neptunochlamydia vexilliferae]